MTHTGAFRVPGLLLFKVGALRVWRKDPHCTPGIPAAPGPWGSSCSSFPKLSLMDLILLGPPQGMVSVRRSQGAGIARDTRSDLLFSWNNDKAVPMHQEGRTKT